MISLIALMTLYMPGQEGSEPNRLEQPRIAQIRKLVEATKTQEAKLKKQLIERQQELITAYAEFELDQKRIERLQEEIVDLQRQLLANYHRFQLGLRQATGPDHFRTIKTRVDQYLQLKGSEAQSDTTSSGARESDPRKTAR